MPAPGWSGWHGFLLSFAIGAVLLHGNRIHTEPCRTGFDFRHRHHLWIAPVRFLFANGEIEHAVAVLQSLSHVQGIPMVGEGKGYCSAFFCTCRLPLEVVLYRNF